jgi:hypothetical protein
MLNSRALRYVALIVSAVATIGCGNVTGPASPDFTEASRLAPPTKSSDVDLSRWILISGVWIEVESSLVK